MSDGYTAYHALKKQGADFKIAHCWAHARRRLFEALEADRERALVGIGFIGLLYDAHR